MAGGTLEVMLISGANLKDSELFGNSDPYAIITCGNQQSRSSTAADQGSNPFWNQKLSFNVTDNVPSISVKLFNENMFKDDEIGTAIIPVAKVFTEGKVPERAYPVIRPSGRPQGEVKVMLMYKPKGYESATSNPSNHGAERTELRGSVGYPPQSTYPPTPYPGAQYDPSQPTGTVQSAVYPPMQNYSAPAPYPPVAYPPASLGKTEKHKEKQQEGGSHGGQPYPAFGQDQRLTPSSYPPQAYPYQAQGLHYPAAKEDKHGKYKEGKQDKHGKHKSKQKKGGKNKHK